MRAKGTRTGWRSGIKTPETQQDLMPGPASPGWQLRSHHSPGQTSPHPCPASRHPFFTLASSFLPSCLTPLASFIKSYWTKNRSSSCRKSSGNNKPSSTSSFLITTFKPHISSCHSMDKHTNARASSPRLSMFICNYIHLKMEISHKNVIKILMTLTACWFFF